MSYLNYFELESSSKVGRKTKRTTNQQPVKFLKTPLSPLLVIVFAHEQIRIQNTSGAPNSARAFSCSKCKPRRNGGQDHLPRKDRFFVGPLLLNFRSPKAKCQNNPDGSKWSEKIRKPQYFLVKSCYIPIHSPFGIVAA